MPDEKDAGSASSTDVETKVDESKATATHDDDEPVEKDVPWNKDKRFQDFLTKRKTLQDYESIGSPDEIRQVVQYAQSLEARIGELEDKRDPGEPKSDEQKSKERALKEARTQLGEIAPELERIEGLSKAEESRGRALELRALDETGKLLKGAGMAATQNDAIRMSYHIAHEIGADPVLHAEYWTGNPREAVREAFTRLANLGKSVAGRKDAAALQADKEKLTKLPKTHGASGGTSGSKGAEPIRGIKDAYERSKNVLKEQE